MKVALYTANFGGIDVVRPMPKGKLFDTFYFTDDPSVLHSDVADHVMLLPQVARDGTTTPPRRLAKALKLTPWNALRMGYPTDDEIWEAMFDCRTIEIAPHHDVSIWVDASADIHDGDAFVKMATSRLPFGLWKHPDRDNIVDEISLSRQLHKYAGVRFDAQLSAYGNIHALWATGVIVRDHNDPLVRSCMEMWWDEMTKYDSWQDQVSLPYVLQQTGLVPNAFPESLWSNQWVGWANHLHHD